MQSAKLAKPKPGPSTQEYLDIAEIKEDVVVMKDGTMRAVLLVSSINFALKSEDEQNAIVASYMQFLNSLDFPLQVVIQSRRLNVDAYLERLRVSEKDQKNELLRGQIADYRNFVGELITLGQIMQKRFFVVVPLDPVTDSRRGFYSRFMDVLFPALSLRLQDKIFRDRRQSLMLRVEHVMGGLTSMSVSPALLDTQALIELYYSAYNPDVYDSEKMVAVDKLRVTDSIGNPL
jgi:hypothetical protein